MSTKGDIDAGSGDISQDGWKSGKDEEIQKGGKRPGIITRGGFGRIDPTEP